MYKKQKNDLKLDFHLLKHLFYLLNPFHATSLFRCPLKTSENQRFSDVFRRYRKRLVALNGLKMIDIALYFILWALFVLKIFKFLPWIFGHVEKATWLGRQSYFQSLWPHDLINKKLQYLYCTISREVNATRHWKLVRY